MNKNLFGQRLTKKKRNVNKNSQKYPIMMNFWKKYVYNNVMVHKKSIGLVKYTS